MAQPVALRVMLTDRLLAPLDVDDAAVATLSPRLDVDAETELEVLDDRAAGVRVVFDRRMPASSGSATVARTTRPSVRIWTCRQVPDAEARASAIRMTVDMIGNVQDGGGMSRHRRLNYRADQRGRRTGGVFDCAAESP